VCDGGLGVRHTQRGIEERPWEGMAHVFFIVVVAWHGKNALYMTEEGTMCN
jgi:hypothetical protein